MIVVTGSLGFIGSCLISKLNEYGYQDIIVVDNDTNDYKNLYFKNVKKLFHKDEFLSWLNFNHQDVNIIYHLGARTDTTEFNKEILNQLNTAYSKAIWNACVNYQIPLVYASSAATYGLGEYGFDDDESLINKLVPLNPYGESKNDFDKWVLDQEHKPPFWVGLKFFNVYGPNEYHKGRMASVVYHAYNQIKENGYVNLFRSHNPKYNDGEQLRDFIYVKDVVEICISLRWKVHALNISGIYNLGTGVARTFNDLAKAVFSAMGKDFNIRYIDTPIEIRDKYQYHTVANMDKFYNAGLNKEFTTLEDGVKDYVQNYLINSKYY